MKKVAEVLVIKFDLDNDGNTTFEGNFDEYASKCGLGISEVYGENSYSGNDGIWDVLDEETQVETSDKVKEEYGLEDDDYLFELVADSGVYDAMEEAFFNKFAKDRGYVKSSSLDEVVGLGKEMQACGEYDNTEWYEIAGVLADKVVELKK